MNIIKRFISKIFKVVVVLLVFLTLNVTPIKAETEYTEDNILYAIGSFINSTQKGISKRINESDIVNLGRNYAKTLMDNGSRMSDIVKVRGNEILFNPHGKSNIGNFIDSVYGTYNDFANYAVSRVEDDRYIVNINKTYTANYVEELNDKLGFMIVWGNPRDVLPRDTIDYHTVDVKQIGMFNTITYYVDTSSSVRGRIRRYYRNREYDYDSNLTETVISNGVYSYQPSEKTIGSGIGAPDGSVTSTNRTASVHVHRAVFHNRNYVQDEDIVPFNRDEIPTKEEFVTNITNIYEPNKFYSYNFDEVLNENTVINNNYVTNNYITVEVADDDDDDDAGSGFVGKDYTSLLDKILASIKALPDAIADKLDFPEGSGEEGGGFWSGLFGAIGDLVSGFSDFLTSIPNLFIELFDGLLGLVEKVVELFVPSAEQVEELKGSLQLLVDDLTGKFDFVLEPVNQIKTVYSEPKSIYDLTIEYDEQVFHVVPSFLKSSLDKLKVLLNGSVVLFTFISIYKRFVGREDVIK